eukprot:5267168-Pleurochrysis_carterae.AAC.2
MEQGARVIEKEYDSEWGNVDTNCDVSNSSARTPAGIAVSSSRIHTMPIASFASGTSPFTSSSSAAPVSPVGICRAASVLA